jgi:hypothetical protein
VFEKVAWWSRLRTDKLTRGVNGRFDVRNSSEVSSEIDYEKSIVYIGLSINMRIGTGVK